MDFAKTRQALIEGLPLALADADNELSPIAREALSEVLAEIEQRSIRLKQILQRMRTLAECDPAYEQLQTIPDIGPIIAPALLANVGGSIPSAPTKPREHTRSLFQRGAVVQLVRRIKAPYFPGGSLVADRLAKRCQQVGRYGHSAPLAIVVRCKSST